jgi:hypothetical protein
VTSPHFFEYGLLYDPNISFFVMLDRKVGFKTFAGTLKLYRFEDDKLVHELDVIHENFTQCDVLEQMYDDHVILREDLTDEIKYMFHSLLSNATAQEIVINGKDCLFCHQVPSLMAPVMYLCYDDTYNYFICEINCITKQLKQLYSTPYEHVTILDADHGIKSVCLAESERGKYLEIKQLGSNGRYMEIFDLNEKKIIFQSKFIDDRNYYGVDLGWNHVIVNPWAPYFCVAGNGNISIFDMTQPRKTNFDDKEPECSSFAFGPGFSHAQVFAKYYYYNEVFTVNWLNEDIVTYKLEYRPPAYVESKGVVPSQIFYSIKKRKEIARVCANLGDFFLNGDTVFGFTAENDMIKIELDMLYLHNKENVKKRKLVDSAEGIHSDSEQRKKRKISSDEK